MQRIVERPQIRRYFLLEIPRQKAKRFTRFDGWSSQNDAIYLLLLQSSHGHRHGEVSLASAGRSKPEDHVVLLDSFEVISLPKRASDNRRLARRRNNLGRDQIAEIFWAGFVHGIQRVIKLMPLNIGAALARAFQLRENFLGF